MKTFFTNIRKHKFIALGCMVLIISAVAINFVFEKHTSTDRDSSSADDGVSDSSSAEGTAVNKSFFEKTKYPVNVTEKEGKIFIDLDGSASSDLKWECENKAEDKVSISNEADENEGKLTAVVTPRNAGYATVSFARNGELEGMKYSEVKIDVDVFVTNGKDQGLYVKLSDIHEDTASAGARDSKAPYLLQENKVILPKGGDWTLTPTGDKDRFSIFSAEDTQGRSYFLVRIKSMTAKDGKSVALKEEPLVLESKSQGIKHKLVCELNEYFEPVLRSMEV
ncbi:MAG: hypothetical protein IKH90_06655 [Ruminococcus sp.]|nr:hypothetical protein [Ruminococcus sp.]